MPGKLTYPMYAGVERPSPRRRAYTWNARRRSTNEIIAPQRPTRLSLAEPPESPVRLLKFKFKKNHPLIIQKGKDGDYLWVWSSMNIEKFKTGLNEINSERIVVHFTGFLIYNLYINVYDTFTVKINTHS